MQEVLRLLANRDFLITKKHYGHGTAKHNLKIIYVVGHVFDHTQFSNLGYGIVMVESIDDLKLKTID